MPSSISSSDPRLVDAPLPDRPLPSTPLGGPAIVAMLLFAISMVAWEGYWRDYGAEPAFRNSDGQWAIQRRRIDHGEGGKTVLLGASRILFDVQLEVWERLAGERPIQLALEGTSPVSVLEDLAADPDFTGRLIVGVAPDVYFSGFEYRGEAFRHYRDETPSQRAGEWLSMRFLEPYFAFYEPDFALFTVLARQAWPRRAGLDEYEDVRKLSVSAADRNTHMWRKVEVDSEYQAMAQRIWAQWFDVPPPGGAAGMKKALDESIERSVAAVAKLRARGIPVVFVRAPSDRDYLAYEDRDFPRASTWDVLLARTGAPGIHFQDYPDMQGLFLPEWSHLAHADARKFTEALYRAVKELQAQPPAAR